MFIYEKKLQFPVKISTPNPNLAAVIISQYGGPDGELGASMRYLSQRYSMPYAEAKGLLTDIGTEELGHMEMVAAIVHQLTRNHPLIFLPNTVLPLHPAAARATANAVAAIKNRFTRWPCSEAHLRYAARCTTGPRRRHC